MKKVVYIFLLLFFFPIFLSSCGQTKQVSDYKLNIVFDSEAMSLSVNQSVDYVNNSDNAFDCLKFHLYPNAFREGAKASPVSVSNLSRAYPNGESYGGIDVKSVKIWNESVNFKICGEEENILTIPLSNLLYPDERVKISMEYSVTLPNVNHRFGYGEKTINLANFYPIACVYDEGKGFMEKLYSSNGDPFYSDISNYDVTIEYDKNLILSSTGDGQTKIINDKKETHCKANLVRDFAIVLSKDFQVLGNNVEDIEIKYFFTDDEEAEKSLKISSDALSFFSEKFGKYPYKTLSVVQNDFFYGGMEYPNLVMISNDISDEVKNYVIVHEIAHQWWYGIVGNNEYDEAWVDESMTEYSTALFFENHNKYGFDYEIIVTNANSSFKFFFDVYKSILKEVDTSMDRSINEFVTEPEYFHSVYTQGVIMFDSLRQLVGEKKLYKCFKNYYNSYAFSNATGADLIASFSRSCGHRLDNFFESYLEGKVFEI